MEGGDEVRPKENRKRFMPLQPPGFSTCTYLFVFPFCAVGALVCRAVIHLHLHLHDGAFSVAAWEESGLDKDEEGKEDGAHDAPKHPVSDRASGPGPHPQLLLLFLFLLLLLSSLARSLARARACLEAEACSFRLRGRPRPLTTLSFSVSRSPSSLSRSLSLGLAL